MKAHDLGVAVKDFWSTDGPPEIKRKLSRTDSEYKYLFKKICKIIGSDVTSRLQSTYHGLYCVVSINDLMAVIPMGILDISIS